MKTRKSQNDRVVIALETSTKPQTTAMLTKRTGVPKGSIRKRVYDLREEGFNIASDLRRVGSKNKVYYSLA